MAAKVVVSLVTYNGQAWLPGCLAALAAQTHDNFEVRIFDNASADSTAAIAGALTEADRRFNLYRSPANLGFAGGHNRNLAATDAEYAVVLNQDTSLAPDFLDRVGAALDARPKVGAVQPRVLNLLAPGEPSKLIDTTGLAMARTRRVVSRRQGASQDKRDLVPGPVWGVDGPIAVYRTAALRSASHDLPEGPQIFDESFFMYKEDVDLAWRLRLAGWSAWYEPTAVGWHARDSGAKLGASLLGSLARNRQVPLWIRTTSWRNHRLMMIKNERVADVVRDLPWIAAREAGALAFMAALDPRRLAAVAQAARLAPEMLRKRAADATTSQDSSSATRAT
jgi:GT2 family glycosyltransferase